MGEKGVRLRIGKLAGRTGTSVRTIRYYEQRGLLAPIGRTPAGYRLYDQRAILVLKTIRKLRMLGLSIADITELKRGYNLSKVCDEPMLGTYIGLLEQRLKDVDRRMTELQDLKKELTEHRDRLEGLRRTDRKINGGHCREPQPW